MIWRAIINQVLNSGEGLRPVFQPIYTVTETPRIVGYEALARFDIVDGIPLEDQTTESWFREAHARDFGVELEMMAIACALPVLPLLEPDVYVAVNVSAVTLLTEGLAEVVLKAIPERIVVELTEHDATILADPLKVALDRLRGATVGVRLVPDEAMKLARLAIDDVGAGYSGLARIVELRPNILKLDRSLIQGLHDDHVKRALVAGIVMFAVATEMKVVAEGVETQEEFDALQALGVDYCQGYLLGKPRPIFEEAVGG